MEKRKIGSLEVSIIGIGCNNFGGRIDEARTDEVCNTALDSGINFFDTADVYGGTKSEEFMGRVLKARRDEAVIATKFGMKLDDEHQGASPAYVRSAIEASLRRLNTDRIDLFQLHRPDPSVPIAEWTFDAQILVVDPAFDDEVGVGRHVEIDGERFGDAHRFAAQVACERELVDDRW